ncbi:MAG: Crp/Fnr family transcriptional regulator, partial [Bacteroidales bacterium]
MIKLDRPPLANCELCLFKQLVRQYISEEEFQPLYNRSIQLKYKKGENILKQGGRFTHIVYLSKGCVKFNYENEFEKKIILTIVDSPKLLGGINIFNDELNMFSITATDECEACLIDINVLKNLALKNSALALRLMEFATSMFRDSILNFISLAHKQVSGRVADILIYLSEKIYKSDKFILTLTRKELSEFAGCSQENIINTLSRF